MAPPLATVPELARRTLGDPAGIVEGTKDHVRAVVALEDASSAAREAAGDLEAWPDPDDAPHPVVRVVLAAARRWWENPEAYTGESLGDSITYSRKAEGLSVELTDAERRTCAHYGPSRSGGLVSSIGLRIGAERRGPSAVTVPVDDGAGDPLPFLAPDDFGAPVPEGVAVAILDRGDQTVTVYPSVERRNGYGTPHRAPSSEGITKTGVYVLQLPAPESAADGQSARRRFRVLGRSLLELTPDELDAYAELEWNGTRLEVDGTPVRRTIPARLAHVVLIARER